LCHFDGNYVKEGLDEMIKLLKESNKSNQQAPKQETASTMQATKLANNLAKSNYSLYIVGGFYDEKSYSIKLTLKLFS
jgi:hypothetical protein